MLLDKVSVIMPSLNPDRFINEAIQSCLDQENLLEIIIVDGGSDISKLSKLENWQNKNNKIKLIIENDTGPAEALNKALLLANGEFIAWLNTDDKFSDGAFRRSLNYFENNKGCLFLYGHGQHINESGEFIEYYPSFKPHYGINQFQNGCFICQPTIFFRKEILYKIGNFDTNLKTCFDFELWLRIFRTYQDFQIGFIDAIQASTRLHEKTITSKNYWRVNLESALILDKYLGKAESHWIEQAARFLVKEKKNFAMGYLEKSDINKLVNNNLRKDYNKLLIKFISEFNNEDYSNVNKRNNYPAVLQKILYERVDLQNCGFNYIENERSFCIWLLNHGIKEYPFIFEGNYKNNDVLKWFATENKNSLYKIYQTIWDSNPQLKKVWLFKKFKNLLKLFLYFRLNYYLSSRGLNYSCFFESRNYIFLNLFYFLKKNISFKNKIPITIVGHVNYQSGIGEDLRTIYIALESKGFEPKIVDFNRNINNRNINNKNIKFKSSSKKFIDNKNGITIVCLNPNECFNYLLSKSRNFFANNYVVGYVPWEFNKWPKLLFDIYKYIDEFWISSKFTSFAFSEFNKPKIIMPLCINNQSIDFNPLTQKDRLLIRNKYNIPNDNLVFLTSFDLESYITRKNPWAVIKSFQRAFNPNYPIKPHNKKVNLLLKTFKPLSNNRDWENLKNLVKLDDRIIIVEDDLDYKQLISLYGSCDVLVSLHRSEGFGRVIAESIILGLEIITTNWGGNTDFCKETNTHLVPYKISQVLPGTYPFWQNQYWAEPDINKASEYMIEIFKGKRLNNYRHGKNLKNLLSIEKSGDRYEKRILEIINHLSQK